MKIKIDTEKKTAKVKDYTLDELLDFMQRIPDWDQYKVKVTQNIIISSVSPNIFDENNEEEEEV
jgi:hypothetical protein